MSLVIQSNGYRVKLAKQYILTSNEKCLEIHVIDGFQELVFWRNVANHDMTMYDRHTRSLRA